MKINKDILILRFSFFLVFQMGGVTTQHLLKI